MRNIKVSPVATEARALSYRLPIAGLVAGARVSLWIGKTLSQQRAIAKTLIPLLWQHPQRSAQGLGRQIRRIPFGVEHQKAPILHDQLQSLQPLSRAPGNP